MEYFNYIENLQLSNCNIESLCNFPSLNLRIINLSKPLIEEKKESKDLKKRELPTQEYLLECFRYDLVTGLLYWKERPLHQFDGNKRIMKSFNSRFKNKLVGVISKEGYLKTGIGDIKFYNHRIIWKLIYGTDPVNIIDHINGNKLDNRSHLLILI